MTPVDWLIIAALVLCFVAICLVLRKEQREFERLTRELEIRIRRERDWPWP